MTNLRFLPRVAVEGLPKCPGEQALEVLIRFRRLELEAPAALCPGVTDVIPSKRQHLRGPTLVHLGCELVSKRRAAVCSDKQPEIEGSRRCVLSNRSGHIRSLDEEVLSYIP